MVVRLGQHATEKVCVVDHSAYTGMGVKTKYGLLGVGGVYIPTSPRLNDLYSAVQTQM